jgi:hypothetical protein
MSYYKQTMVINLEDASYCHPFFHCYEAKDLKPIPAFSEEYVIYQVIIQIYG